MATSFKGSGGGGKEVKRGTSPSSSITKKSPKPSSSTQTDEKSNSTSDTRKSVPNYLKPTMSSSLDFSRIPKKSSTEASAPKAALNRRRSFERPPPPSQVNKAIRGTPAGVRDIKHQRSTSFSNKSVTPPESSSSRPSSEKLYARTSSLKDRKAGPQTNKSYSIKKSTLSSPSTNKREPTSSSSSSTKKPPRSVTSESSVDYESQSVDRLVIEDDFVNIDDSEVQSLPEMSEMPESNSELADPTDIDMKELEDVVEDPKESIVEEDHKPYHEDKSTVIEQVTEDPASPAAVLQETEAEQENEKPEVQTVEEISVDDQPKVEPPAEEQNLAEGAEEEEDESDIKVLEVDPPEIKVEETKKEDVEEPKEAEAEKEVEEEKTEAKDEKVVEETVSSPPADTAAAAPVKTQASATEKKDKQAYNDVIEETATKLMGTSGSKKNKVLALAGAFETVISLQDTKKG